MNIGLMEILFFLFTTISLVPIHVIISQLVANPLKEAMCGGTLVYGISVCMFVAMAITPPDLISMLFMGGLIVFVYCIGTGIYVAIRYKQLTKTNSSR